MDMREKGGNVMSKRAVWLPMVGLLVVLTLVLAACGAAPTETETVSPISTPSTSGSADQTTGIPAEAQEITSLAQKDLAERLGIATDAVKVVSVKAMQWSDTSLGCPKPGMAYATVITPGYKIVLEAEDKMYDYHTGSDNFVLCQDTSSGTIEEQPTHQVNLDPELAALVEEAKVDLSSRFNAAIDEIVLLSASAVQWRDSSLGCPKPGTASLTVITPGYLIKLEAGGMTYEYHADKDRVFYCADPQAPLDAQPAPEQRLLEAAKADLTQRLSIAADQITVVKVEAVQWRDGSLGCPRPGMNYTQAIVPGYQIILSAGGQEYDYHANQERVFLCE
jgi:hypothetical protein